MLRQSTTKWSLIGSRSRSGSSILTATVLAWKSVLLGMAGAILATCLAPAASAQKTRERWNQLCQIQKEKFDVRLPKAMRDNHIDMWIVAMREGANDPNYDMLGGGSYSGYGYYVFSDTGKNRIERATFRIWGGRLTECGAYDVVESRENLRDYIERRNPSAIGVDIATEIGAADGLTVSMQAKLTDMLGPDLARRMVSAERLVSDLRSQFGPKEIEAFKTSAKFADSLGKRALSSDVILPGKTTLADVAAWLSDALLDNDLQSSTGVPTITIAGLRARGNVSDETVIEPGDLLSLEWGVRYLNAYSLIRRMAYVLKPGERVPPAGLSIAFQKTINARDAIKAAIKPGVTAGETLNKLNGVIDGLPGYKSYQMSERPGADLSLTYVLIGSTGTGDEATGSGPSVIIGHPLRNSFRLVPGNPLILQLFATTSVPEWDHMRLNIPLADDVFVTADGVGWASPPVTTLATIASRR